MVGEVVGEEGGSLGGAAGITVMNLVEVGEDLTTSGKTRKIIVVTKRVVMARSPLHYSRKIKLHATTYIIRKSN